MTTLHDVATKHNCRVHYSSIECNIIQYKQQNMVEYISRQDNTLQYSKVQYSTTVDS